MSLERESTSMQSAKVNSKSGVESSETKPRVALFVTCLVNTIRPSVGFSAMSLLESAGCDVHVPMQQGCCGQPAFNSGDDKASLKIAKQLIATFRDYDYVVVPSGSCAGMLKKSFLDVFASQQEDDTDARELSSKTHELLSFLVDVRKFKPKGIELEGKYTYHDSCSGFRSMGVYAQPREMLAEVSGLQHEPLVGHNECCGFGGTFCVKYSNISDAIVTEKVDNIRQTGADYLVGGDLGCLMNMEGKLNRQGSSQVIALHAAEILAGDAATIIEKAKIEKAKNEN